MVRKTILALFAVVMIGLCLPTDTSARVGSGGFRGAGGGFQGGFGGGGFRGRGPAGGSGIYGGGWRHGSWQWSGAAAYGAVGVGRGLGFSKGYGYPYDAGYDYPYGYGEYAEYGRWVHRCDPAQLRIWTPYGWRLRAVQVCN